MADSKISALSDGAPLVDGDLFVIARTGVADYKIALADLMAASRWVPLPTTLTFSSADAPTYVCTTGVDLTGSVGVGMRIKLTHSSTTKYFIVTAIDATTITLYGGTDYTLASGTISNPFYSAAKAPLGFPLDPAKWTVTVTDTSDRAQASPTNGTWYNLGSISISVPIGCWRLRYQAMTDFTRSGSGVMSATVTLSTANNSSSDSTMDSILFVSGTTDTRGFFTAAQEKILTLASKQTNYLNAKVNATGHTSVDFRGDLSTTTIKAVSAYL